MATSGCQGSFKGDWLTDGGRTDELTAHLAAHMASSNTSDTVEKGKKKLLQLKYTSFFFLLSVVKAKSAFNKQKTGFEKIEG